MEAGRGNGRGLCRDAHARDAANDASQAGNTKTWVREIGGFFATRLERLKAAGVAAEQVALDVGIGFGKSVEHNLV